MKSNLFEGIKKNLKEYGIVKKGGKELNEEDIFFISNLFCESFIIMSHKIKELWDIFSVVMNCTANELKKEGFDFKEVKNEKTA